MKKIIKEHGFAFYLGMSLVYFANITFLTWEFYAIFIPVLILINWRDS